MAAPAHVQASLERRIVDEGHLLGSHTDAHANLAESEDVWADIRMTHARLRNLTGRAPWAIRPPYGESDPHVLKVGDAH